MGLPSELVLGGELAVKEPTSSRAVSSEREEKNLPGSGRSRARAASRVITEASLRVMLGKTGRTGASAPGDRREAQGGSGGAGWSSALEEREAGWELQAAEVPRC